EPSTRGRPGPGEDFEGGPVVLLRSCWQADADRPPEVRLLAGLGQAFSRGNNLGAITDYLRDTFAPAIAKKYPELWAFEFREFPAARDVFLGPRPGAEAPSRQGDR